MIHGIVPGPFLIQEQPELFWGVINSMYIGNFVLLILNLPLIGVFVQLLRVRLSILAPIVILITMIGVYTINNRPFDIGIVLVFGILGYLMRKFGFDPGPLVLAYVLGPILKLLSVQSLLISQGDMGIFIERPISVAFLLIAVFLVVTQIWKATVKKPVKASS
jgi:putative tricarboxylic transport membrane protein